MTEFRRLPLKTGITLNVGLAGDPGKPAVILLHGFPESHRTWRGIAPQLQDDFYLVMPDQRGFAGSDRPQEVSAYKPDLIVADLFALAETLDLETFALVGHDWGGAVAWNAALKGDPRVSRLAIINAPHPVIFQKSLIESAEQRAASQYISGFRVPGAEKAIATAGYEAFFDKIFGSNVDLASIPEAEKQEYIAEWSQPGAMNAMLNWYRASPLIVPPPSVTLPVPDVLLKAFAKVKIPTLVIWGMQDTALLPIQLNGLDSLVDDLSVVKLPQAGHFAPWQAADAVTAALRPFLERNAAATGSTG